MKQAPTSVGACAKVARIGGLTAATEHQRQEAQAQESEHRRLGNQSDILKERRAGIAWIGGIIHNL
jgi:hypothetical protein